MSASDDAVVSSCSSPVLSWAGVAAVGISSVSAESAAGVVRVAATGVPRRSVTVGDPKGTASRTRFQGGQNTFHRAEGRLERGRHLRGPSGLNLQVSDRPGFHSGLVPLERLPCLVSSGLGSAPFRQEFVKLCFGAAQIGIKLIGTGATLVGISRPATRP